MMTFLPYPDFARSVACLDYERLGKQRSEVKQMLRALAGIKRGWRNHTATRMWVGHENALAHYGLAACREWSSRGYVDNLWPDIYEFVTCGLNGDYKLPPWFGSHKVHSSHRARLLCKDASFYRPIGWTELPATDYFWPSHTYDWRNRIGDRLDPYYNPSYQPGKA